MNLVATATSLLGLFLLNKLRKKLTAKNDDINEDPPIALKKKKISLRLISKTNISPDTRIFRFALPTEKHSLGLPIGNFVLAFAKKWYFMPFHRAYTPISSNNYDLGYMDLVVKIYFPNVDPKHRKGGRMSMHFENLKIGEYMDFYGPLGFIQHRIKENGVDMSYYRRKLRISRFLVERTNINKIGMIAGGTGIAPMLQLIREIFGRNKYDSNCINKTTEITLIFSNKTNADILFKKELEELAKKSNNRFKVIFTLTRDGWNDYEEGETKVNGQVDRKMIEKYMPHYNDENSSILLCGRPAMVKSCQNIFEEMEWDMRNVFSY